MKVCHTSRHRIIMDVPRIAEPVPRLVLVSDQYGIVSGSVPYSMKLIKNFPSSMATLFVPNQTRTERNALVRYGSVLYRSGSVCPELDGSENLGVYHIMLVSNR